MYTGFKANSSINRSTVSGLNQTQVESLQKQVDVYTQRLQMQKRKYFAIQDQHKSVADQYIKQKERHNQLRKQNSKAEAIILQTKLKNLEATLDKAVSAFDDTVGCNSKLKGQIDMLRRQKKNYMEMQRSLQQQGKKIDEQFKNKMQQLNKKKRKTEDLKQQMVDTKNINQQQRQSYLNQFSSLQKEYLYDKNTGQLSSSKLKNNELISPRSNLKSEIVDTQPLLKFRLKRIIAANKQKIKVIDQYKKHMLLIEEAFNQIKQKSNIQDLDEITMTFIKSEEQNYSLYNYMDSLTQNIDRLGDQNKDLQQKIRRKIEQDEIKKDGLLNKYTLQQSSYKKLFHPQTKQDIEFQAQIKKKQQQNQKLMNLVQKIKPFLELTLVQLSQSPLIVNQINQIVSHTSKQDYKRNLNISERNIEDYLSELEKHINALLIAKQQVQTKTTSQMKDLVTVYSKPIPNVNYEQMIKQKQKNDKIQKEDNNKFLEQNKFRQYAAEFWQKRKNNKPLVQQQSTVNGNQQSVVNGNPQSNQQNSSKVGQNGSVQNLSVVCKEQKSKSIDSSNANITSNNQIEML